MCSIPKEYTTLENCKPHSCKYALDPSGCWFWLVGRKREKKEATHRMVVWRDTVGTVSRFRCIHLTVVRKHRHRLGQQSANWGPQASRKKAAAARSRGERSWPARVAMISSSEANREPAAPARSHTRTRTHPYAQQQWGSPRQSPTESWAGLLNVEPTARLRINFLSAWGEV